MTPLDGSSPAPVQASRDRPPVKGLYSACRAHVLARIDQAAVGTHPFYHAFIEHLFPDHFYQAFHAHMVSCKYGDKIQNRGQDNPAFVNKRTNLFTSTDDVVDVIRRIFSDVDVKLALLKKFYVHPTRELADSLSIHQEFEYFYTKAGRFQNIHVDIPPKYMSFVLYIPEHPASPLEEERNATVLYDKSLTPHYAARFKANSVCIFVPHFYSYHGFDSTIDRDVFVMFYVNTAELARWDGIRQDQKDVPPFTPLLDAIERKLRLNPLIEFGDDERRLVAERASCRVNAPRGRVLTDAGPEKAA
jgi:hypothetical protein